MGIPDPGFLGLFLASAAGSLSWRKKTLFWSILLFLILSIAELGTRLCLASFIGRSILWYVTSFEREAERDQAERSPLLREIRQRELRGAADRNHSARHADDLRGMYFKYKPNQQRVTYDVDTGEVYRVTINRHGFRGKEFSTQKKPGVLRVVTLGSSSTFDGSSSRASPSCGARARRSARSSSPRASRHVPWRCCARIFGESPMRTK